MSSSSTTINTNTTKMNCVLEFDEYSDFTLHVGVEVVVLMLAGLSMIMSIGFATWTFINRRTSRVVMASQPFFLYMICLGVFILSTATISFSAIREERYENEEMHSLECNFRIWLYVIGSSIVLSALEAKLARINKIVRSSQRFIRIKVTVWDTLKHMVVIVGLNVFLLTLMAIFSPIEYVPADGVINDTINGETIIPSGTCDYGGSIDFLIPLIVLFSITMFLMMFQSYNARNLSTDLSESKFIFIILVSFDLVFLLGVPVIILARKPLYVNIRVYVAAAMNCAMSLSVLGWVFVPKIIYDIMHKKASPAVHVVPLSQSATSRSATNRDTSNDVVCSNCGNIVTNGTSPNNNQDNNTDDDDDDDDGKFGERIITRSSKNELLKDNEKLRKELNNLKSTVFSQTFDMKDQDTIMHRHNSVEIQPFNVSVMPSLPFIKESDHNDDDDHVDVDNNAVEGNGISEDDVDI